MTMNFLIGETVETQKYFSKEEITAYTEFSKDNNPIHFDESYASKTIFQKPIVPGLMVASLFGGLLGSVLPGKGTIHLGQELRFQSPVFIDELVTASIEIIEIRPEKSIITFHCVVVKEDDKVAIEGKAIVMYKGEFFSVSSRKFK